MTKRDAFKARVAASLESAGLVVTVKAASLLVSGDAKKVLAAKAVAGRLALSHNVDADGVLHVRFN